jgi:hypothetical protein
MISILCMCVLSSACTLSVGLAKVFCQLANPCAAHRALSLDQSIRRTRPSVTLHACMLSALCWPTVYISDISIDIAAVYQSHRGQGRDTAWMQQELLTACGVLDEPYG